MLNLREGHLNNELKPITGLKRFLCCLVFFCNDFLVSEITTWF